MYVNNAKCEWLLQGAYIRLSFHFFDVEAGYDVVSIFRCATPLCSDSERVVRLAAGSADTSTTYATTTGYLKVVFTSDGFVNKEGFIANYSIYSPPCALSTTSPAEALLTTPTPLPAGTTRPEIPEDGVSGASGSGSSFHGPWSSSTAAGSGDALFEVFQSSTL